MGYSLKPSGMEEAFGYLWPDGAPSSYCENKCHKVEYLDGEGVSYTIAYTEDQIIKQVNRNGVFSPYIPLYVSKLLIPLKRNKDRG